MSVPKRERAHDCSFAETYGVDVDGLGDVVEVDLDQRELGGEASGLDDDVLDQIEPS